MCVRDWPLVGLERSANVAERTLFGGTLLFQCADVLRALQTELYVRIDKRLPLPNSTRYPTSAIQEALVNAYIHGDPRTNTPIHVDVFPDRIEITSIGAPPSGVTLDQATNIPLSNLRYRGLASFFLGVRLAQTLGTGVKRMREALLSAGCPPVEFEVGEAHVRCVIREAPAPPDVEQLEAIARLLRRGRGAEALPQIEARILGGATDDLTWHLWVDAIRLAGADARAVIASWLSHGRPNSSHFSVLSDAIAVRLVQLVGLPPLTKPFGTFSPKVWVSSPLGRFMHDMVERLLLAQLLPEDAVAVARIAADPNWADRRLRLLERCVTPDADPTHRIVLAKERAADLVELVRTAENLTLSAALRTSATSEATDARNALRSLLDELATCPNPDVATEAAALRTKLDPTPG